MLRLSTPAPSFGRGDPKHCSNELCEFPRPDVRTLSAGKAGAGIAQTMGLASQHLTEVGRLVKFFAD